MNVNIIHHECQKVLSPKLTHSIEEMSLFVYRVLQNFALELNTKKMDFEMLSI